MTQLWKHNRKIHSAIAAYTIGDDATLDQILLPYDIEATKAHILGLVKIGILTKKEVDSLIKHLNNLLKLWKAGKVKIRIEDEDCHTVIENYLVNVSGDLGKKVHTGRSRNDQVLVALRLYMRDQLVQINKTALSLATEFLNKAHTFNTTPFPGYSHTQQAMPTSLGHYYASFIESLLDDVEFSLSSLEHINKNPLGAAAGFGVAFPLDRELTMTKLNFSDIQINSLYTQNSRGKYESIYLESLVQIMLTLGKFANDMLIFTSREFGFFIIDESVTTGSTIMPQKRNLDGLELLRGYVSVVIANQHAVQDIAKSIISGYNRDFQLIKKSLMECSHIVLSSIEIANIYLISSQPNVNVIQSKIVPDILSADRANELVTKKGIPFREAHRLVAESLADSNIKLTASELKENIKSKISLGGPGNIQLPIYTKRLQDLSTKLNKYKVSALI